MCTTAWFLVISFLNQRETAFSRSPLLHMHTHHTHTHTETRLDTSECPNLWNIENKEASTLFTQWSFFWSKQRGWRDISSMLCLFFRKNLKKTISLFLFQKTVNSPPKSPRHSDHITHHVPQGNSTDNQKKSLHLGFLMFVFANSTSLILQVSHA